MNCILIIGKSGEGKTYFTKKNFVLNKDCFVIDVNLEYDTDRRTDPGGLDAIKSPKLSGDMRTKRSRYIWNNKIKSSENIRNFLFVAAQKTNCNIIFDEATLFFSGALTSDTTKSLIIGRKHKNVNCIFLFHAIRDVPPFFYAHANYVVLFKTEDTADNIPNKGEFLIPYFNKVKKMPKHGFLIIDKENAHKKNG